jgi:hypothetical protein
MAVVAPMNPSPDQHQLHDKAIGLMKILNRVAAHPWALSFTSFTLTALLIRWNDLLLLREAAI